MREALDFTHPHFAEPQWLWLAVLGPLLLFALQRYSAWRRQRQLAQLASPKTLGRLTRSYSPFRREFKNGLLLLAVVAFGIALARPQWGETESSGRLLGHDTVFILDCSRSMLATDVTPNRLQRSKLAIRNYVQRQARGRLGLVAFAGEAFLQCPLTFDYGAFEDALNAVDDRTIPVLGTDIGRAIDEGYRAIDKHEEQKVVVLLTDGEDLQGRGITNAVRLAKEGVIVFAVGVGTPAGEEIRYLNEQGKVELMRNKKGDVVHSRLDENTLRGIAEVTRGQYFPLGPLGEGLAKVQVALDTMASSGSSPARKLGVDRFHLPVAILLGLLVIESLVGTRRLVRDSGGGI